MIKIKEPRYRDRTVLLAEHRLFVGEDVDFLIVSGAYKGKYHVAWEDIDGAGAAKPVKCQRETQPTSQCVRSQFQN